MRFGLSHVEKNAAVDWLVWRDAFETDEVHKILFVPSREEAFASPL